MTTCFSIIDIRLCSTEALKHTPVKSSMSLKEMSSCELLQMGGTEISPENKQHRGKSANFRVRFQLSSTGRGENFWTDTQEGNERYNEKQHLTGLNSLGEILGKQGRAGFKTRSVSDLPSEAILPPRDSGVWCANKHDHYVERDTSLSDMSLGNSRGSWEAIEGTIRKMNREKHFEHLEMFRQRSLASRRQRFEQLLQEAWDWRTSKWKGQKKKNLQQTVKSYLMSTGIVQLEHSREIFGKI